MVTELDLDSLFEDRIELPDSDAHARLARLIGLDDHKLRLQKILGLLVNPAGLQSFVELNPGTDRLVESVLARPPLVVLCGDVGSGKTELAETIGDSVARQENLDVTLLPLSLSTRGQGRVGEMTRLVSAAFAETLEQARKLRSSSGENRGAVILLVDEADALAQSREASQMHHEDRAGVNAFIRGVDRLAHAHVPAAVIMCTNRLGSLDPAIRRRAAEILTFERPNGRQRHHILRGALEPLGFTGPDVDALVAATGPRGTTKYGFTFSDLIQRLLPSIVLDAYPSSSITPKSALRVAEGLSPTPPFREEAQ